MSDPFTTPLCATDAPQYQMLRGFYLLAKRGTEKTYTWIPRRPHLVRCVWHEKALRSACRGAFLCGAASYAKPTASLRRFYDLRQCSKSSWLCDPSLNWGFCSISLAETGR